MLTAEKRLSTTADRPVPLVVSMERFIRSEGNRRGCFAKIVFGSRVPEQNRIDCLENWTNHHTATSFLTSLLIQSGNFPDESIAPRMLAGCACGFAVKGFLMDRIEVTNADFAKCVETIGYKTIAEIARREKSLSTLRPRL